MPTDDDDDGEGAGPIIIIRRALRRMWEWMKRCLSSGS